MLLTGGEGRIFLGQADRNELVGRTVEMLVRESRTALSGKLYDPAEFPSSPVIASNGFDPFRVFCTPGLSGHRTPDHEGRVERARIHCNQQQGGNSQPALATFRPMCLSPKAAATGVF
jgi:hypothetical protein